MNGGLVRRVGLVAFAVFLSALQLAWGQADDKAKQIEAAKKEGKLIWYTSTNVTESKPLLDDFEKLYPAVKGEIFRASGEKTLNRIVTESRANHWEYDVVTISEVDALADAKLLGAYKSPEASSIIPQFKDRNGYWTAVYINYMTLGHNAKMVAEKDAPNSGKIFWSPNGTAKSLSIRRNILGLPRCIRAGAGRERRSLCGRWPSKTFSGAKATL